MDIVSFQRANGAVRKGVVLHKGRQTNVDISFTICKLFIKWNELLGLFSETYKHINFVGILRN